MPYSNENVHHLYHHGLVFLDSSHLEAFKKLVPSKLRDDIEWVPTVYVLTSDHELRSKTNRHIQPSRREIKWCRIMSADFGSGHRAAANWAYGLWATCNWGGWQDDTGKEIPHVDTISVSYSMGPKLRFVALVAQAYRWGMQDLYYTSPTRTSQAK